MEKNRPGYYQELGELSPADTEEQRLKNELILACEAAIRREMPVFVYRYYAKVYDMFSYKYTSHWAEVLEEGNIAAVCLSNGMYELY